MLEVLLLRIRWIVREQEVEMTADDGGVVSFGVFHHHANVCLPSALFEHVFGEVILPPSIIKLYNGFLLVSVISQN